MALVPPKLAFANLRPTSTPEEAAPVGLLSNTDATAEAALAALPHPGIRPTASSPIDSPLAASASPVQNNEV